MSIESKDTEVTIGYAQVNPDGTLVAIPDISLLRRATGGRLG